MGRRNTIVDVFKHLRRCQHGDDCDKCCWLWQGRVDKDGRPQIGFWGGHWAAAKVLFILQKGLSPLEPFYACHTCNNKECCNWNHIYKGTAETNARDRVRQPIPYTYRTVSVWVADNGVKKK